MRSKRPSVSEREEVRIVNSLVRVAFYDNGIPMTASDLEAYYSTLDVRFGDVLNLLVNAKASSPGAILGGVLANYTERFKIDEMVTMHFMTGRGANSTTAVLVLQQGAVNLVMAYSADVTK